MAQPTNVQSWKKKAKQGMELKLPSGNTCLARRPGIQVFLQRGFIPNSLMDLVTEGMKAGGNDAAAEAISKGLDLQDLEKLNDLLGMIDQITCYCVVEPEVRMPPSDPTDRSDDQLYADEVDLDDKMFIFQWAVGGTKDLERFRGEQASRVAALQPRSDVEGSS